jgi:hypothetical protein
MVDVLGENVEVTVGVANRALFALARGSDRESRCPNGRHAIYNNSIIVCFVYQLSDQRVSVITLVSEAIRALPHRSADITVT